MPLEMFAVVGKLLYESARGALNGLTKGFTESKAKQLSEPKKSNCLIRVLKN